MDSGSAYTYTEFLEYAVSVGKGSDFGDQLWQESSVYDEVVQDFGYWSGVVVSPISDKVIANVNFHSSYPEHQPLVRRSWSCGDLTEGGNATERHPSGHPTAFGSGWLAAR